MDRRAFLSGLAVFAASLGAEAQTAGRVYRVGFLWDSPAIFPGAIEAFHRGLRDLGWIEGQNIVVEVSRHMTAAGREAPVGREAQSDPEPRLLTDDNTAPTLPA